MNDSISMILGKIEALEQDLRNELHRGAQALQFKIHNGRIVFEKAARSAHRALRTSTWHYIRDARWVVIMTAPLIYALIIPFVVLDLFITIYQAICFPIYGMPKVKRGDYFVYDRVKLDYLNAIEKFNCVYCSYGNGVIAYSQEVAARTEHYWCPIKHATSGNTIHSHYRTFSDFGDAETYHRNHKQMRDQAPGINKEKN